MKDSVYIVIALLVVVLVGEMVGVTYLKVGKDESTQTKSTILGSSVDMVLVAKLCENYNVDSNQLTQTKEKPRSVQQCGKYYRVNPPKEKIASPFKMVNKKGEVAAICGGANFGTEMSSFEQPECETSCGLENLCGQ